MTPGDSAHISSPGSQPHRQPGTLVAQSPVYLLGSRGQVPSALPAHHDGQQPSSGLCLPSCPPSTGASGHLNSYPGLRPISSLAQPVHPFMGARSTPQPHFLPCSMAAYPWNVLIWATGPLQAPVSCTLYLQLSVAGVLAAESGSAESSNEGVDWRLEARLGGGQEPRQCSQSTHKDSQPSWEPALATSPQGAQAF